MTDRRAVRRPGLRAVGAASGLAFVLVLALLVAQMRLGRDPVLGARGVAATAAAPRKVLVRRVVVKRVVVDEIEDVDDGGATAAPASAPGAGASAAPTPGPAPPSPPPVSAPPPPPAPLVTKSS
jgi:hypothetical protein